MWHKFPRKCPAERNSIEEWQKRGMKAELKLRHWAKLWKLIKVLAWKNSSATWLYFLQAPHPQTFPVGASGKHLRRQPTNPKISPDVSIDDLLSVDHDWYIPLSFINLFFPQLREAESKGLGETSKSKDWGQRVWMGAEQRKKTPWRKQREHKIGIQIESLFKSLQGGRLGDL